MEELFSIYSSIDNLENEKKKIENKCNKFENDEKVNPSSFIIEKGFSNLQERYVENSQNLEIFYAKKKTLEKEIMEIKNRKNGSENFSLVILKSIL